MTDSIIEIFTETSSPIIEVFTETSTPIIEVPIGMRGPRGPEGPEGPIGPQGLKGEDADDLLNLHIEDGTPHSAYDDMPNLTLLFENGLT